MYPAPGALPGVSGLFVDGSLIGFCVHVDCLSIVSNYLKLGPQGMADINLSIRCEASELRFHCSFVIALSSPMSHAKALFD